jgi:hypothetical protein
MRPEVFQVHNALSLISLPVSQQIYALTLVVFVLSFLAWISFELIQFFKQRRISIPALFILFTILLHVFCFLLSYDMLTSIFPLLIVHGVSYWFLVNRVVPQDKVAPVMPLWLKMLAIVLIFGGLDFYLTQNEDHQNLSHWMVSVAVGLTLGPSLWHYIVDAWLWKSQDPDMIQYFHGR